MPELKKWVEKALRKESVSEAELAIAAAVNRLLSERGAMTVDDLVAHFRGIFGAEMDATGDAEAEIIRRLRGGSGRPIRGDAVK